MDPRNHREQGDGAAVFIARSTYANPLPSAGSGCFCLSLIAGSRFELLIYGL